MSTRLLTEEGKSYPSTKVFVNGILDKSALARYGLPRLTGTFAYAMFMANAAVSRSSSWMLTRANEVDRRSNCPYRSILGRRRSSVLQSSQSREVR